MPLLQLAPTTVAMLLGHTDAGFSLKAYARDARNEAAIVEDVLQRAAVANVGG